MKSHRCKHVLALLLTGCAFEAPSSETEGVASVEQDFYYNGDELWENRSIKVCFINEAGSTEARWLRAAVENAWEGAANIDLVGWGACQFSLSLNGPFLPGGYPEDIRIEVGENLWPKSKVGTASKSNNRESSMKMNFFRTTARDFDGDGSADLSGCYSNAAAQSATGRIMGARQLCIEAIAVHEFGHALGVVHEANRPDSMCPSTSGSEGTAAVGPYDPLSIMNYCTPIWNNDGLLSSWDIAGIQTLYGRGSNDYIWASVGNVRDIAAANFDGLLFRSSAQNHSGHSRPFAGDFNGDARGDVFWYEPGTGADSISWNAPLGFVSDGSQSVEGTYVPIVGRFDADAMDDVYWYAPGSGRDFIWFGRESGVFNQGVSAKAFDRAGTFIPLVGDFDRDGRRDIFWYQAGSGADYIWWGTATRGAFTEVVTEVSGTFRPVAGDFDGDGATDIEWYAPGSATDYTWFGSSTRNFVKNRNMRSVGGTYEPFVGDFDGNGCDDIFWNALPVAAEDSVWLGLPGSNNPASVKIWVRDGDYVPLVADYDGNDMEDIYWYTR